MNRIYALLWSRTLGAWRVVSELASRRTSLATRRRGARSRLGSPYWVGLLLLANGAAQAQTTLGSSNTTQTLNSDHDYLVNQGTSIATNSGNNALDVRGIAPATISNFGRLSGAASTAWGAVGFNVDGTLINQSSGLVYGTGYAVWARASSLMAVSNYGDITAANGQAISFSDTSSGSVDNYGSLNGGVSGSISNDANGIEVATTGSVAINNHAGASILTGLGSGGKGYAIRITKNALLTLTNSGSITGRQAAVSSVGTSAHTNITNMPTGLLSGGARPALDLISDNTVRNAGIISGPSGAITFGGNNNRLELESTSRITGAVLGGSNGTLALVGTSTDGVFDLDLVGTSTQYQYRNFSKFLKDESGTWTLTGASKLSWQVNNGRLILGDGTFMSGPANLTIQPGGIFQYGAGGTGSFLSSSIQISNNGEFVFNRGEDTVYTTVLSGAGAVVQQGPGRLTLTASNTYTGETRVGPGAVLQVGNAGTTGSVSGSVINNGQLVFNRSNAVTYGGTVSGSGSLSQIGAGILTLTGQNTYTGGTSIEDGRTLQVGNGGEQGAIAGDIANSGTLIVNRSGSLQFSGVISGDGTLIKRGAGVLQLTASNTYAGSTRLEGGVLAATSANNFGALGNGLLFDGGTLRWLNTFFVGRPAELLGKGGTLDSNGLAVEWRSATTGVGGLSKTGLGTLYLTGANTYTGGSSVLAGTLQVGMGGTSGSVVGDINNQAQLIFNRSDDYLFSGVISGTGAVTQQGPGRLILTGHHTYTGGTRISGGSLQLGNGGASGGLTGNVVNDGQLIFNRSDDINDASGLISGSGSVTQVGPGILSLTHDHLYTGATRVAGGTLRIGDGGVSGSIRGDVINNASLIRDRSDNVSYAGALSGTGTFIKQGSGNLTMTGHSPYTGTTLISGGSLIVNGSLGGHVDVSEQASLAGAGSVLGVVEVADGGYLAPGAGVGTLTVGGLILHENSQLDMELGMPDTSSGSHDHVSVSGDVTLDGVLNITDVGGFSNGVYQLIDYGGNLADNGIRFGALPEGVLTTSLQLQTAVAHQINLVVRQEGLSLQFWDGQGAPANGGIEGGSGVWNSSNTDWTTTQGHVNESWQNGFAVFQGQAGTVTLGETIRSNGLQFRTDGYVIQGNGFTLQSSIRVLPVRVDAGVTATLNAGISDNATGVVQLVKLDQGTLVLGADSSYSGGTSVKGGRLQVSADSHLGAANGGLSLDAGALATTASFSSGRGVTLGEGHGVFSPAAGTVLTWSGDISGPGGLVKEGAGTLLLRGNNGYGVATAIADGVLDVDRDARLGAANAAVALAGGTLRWAADFNLAAGRQVVLRANGAFDTQGYSSTLVQAITGEGALIKQGSGTLTLSGDNLYAGGTYIQAGTLQIGNGGNSGNVLGEVRNDATLAFARSDSYVFGGRVTGSGALQQRGSGTLVLTAEHAYSGGTAVIAGRLMLGNGGHSGSVSGDIQNAGEVIFNRSDNVVYAGSITGVGKLTKLQSNTLILTGDHTFSGGTTISAGQLRIGGGGDTGSLHGDVVNEGELAFQRSGSLTFAGRIEGGGSLRQMGDGVVILNGVNSYSGGTFLDGGVLSVASDAALGAAASQVNFNGGSLRLTDSFDSARAFQLQAGDGVIETVGSRNKLDSVLEGKGRLVKLGDGVLVLNQGASHTGGTWVQAGTLVVGDSSHPEAVLRNSAVHVAAGGALGGYGAIIGNVTNEGLIGVGNALPALRLEPDAVFTVAGNVDNRGVVSLINGVGGDRLVLRQGAFISNGGIVRMEVLLGHGGDESGTDLLILDSVRRAGNAVTGLDVAVVGDEGKSMSRDGVRLVDVATGGESAPGAFVLTNRVTSGAREYLLFQGGVTRPDDGDWYLRSELQIGGQTVALMRPEVGSFLGNRFVAERLLVHDLHDRQGEPKPGWDGSEDGRGLAWANVGGNTVRTQAANGVIEIRSRTWRLQTGMDIWRHRNAGGSLWRVGGLLQYGHASNSSAAHHNPGQSHGEVRGYSAGIYASWLGNPQTQAGTYVDGWLQYGKFDNQLEGTGGYTLDYDAKAWSASLEAGFGVALTERIVLQPQLQYARLRFDTEPLIDPSRTRIRDIGQSDWVARYGVRLYGVPERPDGLSPFVEYNYYRRAGNASVRFNQDLVQQVVPLGLSMLDVGVQGRWAAGWAGWLRLGSDLSHANYDELNATLGLRYQW